MASFVVISASLVSLHVRRKAATPQSRRVLTFRNSRVEADECILAISEGSTFSVSSARCSPKSRASSDKTFGSLFAPTIYGSDIESCFRVSHTKTMFSYEPNGAFRLQTCKCFVLFLIASSLYGKHLEGRVLMWHVGRHLQNSRPVTHIMVPYVSRILAKLWCFLQVRRLW
jgi:hypothetical protein